MTRQLRHLLLLAVWLSPISSLADGETWIHLSGKAYGARADDVGPIGGGEGYPRAVTKGG